MRVLITGTAGQIDTAVSALGETLGISITRLGLPDIDLSRLDSFLDPILAARPDVIISSAAYTSVDKAESEPELAQTINGDAPGELARIANSLDIPILHLSTDYVFSGDKDSPYVETDEPRPVGVYGRTKLSGEKKVSAATANHVILRTAWVYSPYGHNFVKTMLKLGESQGQVNVVADQYGTPTYAPEIARALLAIAQQVVVDADPTLRGIFHLTGVGETNWAGFAQAIFDGAENRGRKPVHVNAIPSEAYPTLAKRPLNSCLSSEKLDEIYGLCLNPWRISLDSCLDQLITSVQD